MNHYMVNPFCLAVFLSGDESSEALNLTSGPTIIPIILNEFPKFVGILTSVYIFRMAKFYTMDTEQVIAKPWYVTLHQLADYLIHQLGGGKQTVKLSNIINLHKGGTLLFVLVLMYVYHNFSLDAWIYLALHGSYGICWVLKHLFFRDKRWERKVTWGSAIFTWFFLASYWVAPWLLISDPPLEAADSGFYASGIMLYVLGLFLMIGADGQKHFTLKFHPGLITTGMYSSIRHPNYLGEMMVYASFALISRHWISWVILVVWWALFFLPNMLMIERSVSRYPGWKAYTRQAGFLWPKW